MNHFSIHLLLVSKDCDACGNENPPNFHIPSLFKYCFCYFISIFVKNPFFWLLLSRKNVFKKLEIIKTWIWWQLKGKWSILCIIFQLQFKKTYRLTCRVNTLSWWWRIVTIRFIMVCINIIWWMSSCALIECINWFLAERND